MSPRRLKVMEERCVGCRICELACSLEHRSGASNPRNGLLRIESRREMGPNKNISGIEVIHICRQCDPAPCAESCPVEAFAWDQDLAIRTVDSDRCSGCERCLDACPYGMVLMNGETETAEKCDLCGGDPLCVRYCPAGALVFLEQENPAHAG